MSLFVLIPLIIWEVYWKYHALWIAAKKSHKGWFLALLVINSIGLLPIYYLYKQEFFKK